VDLGKKHEKLVANHRAVKYNFILTELDLAFTFCEMAIASHDKAKSERNTENARRAFDAATYFLDEGGFSESEKSNVRRKVTTLKALLKQLTGPSTRVAPQWPSWCLETKAL